MRKNHNHLPRGTRRDAWARAHDPRNAPAMTWRDWLITALIFSGALMMLLTPGILADVGGLTLADGETGRQLGIMLRTAVVMLNAWALLGVRAMHPATRSVHLLIVLGMAMRLAEVRMTGEPLTLSYAVLLLGMALIAARTITRPNESEQIETLTRELKTLRR